MIVQRGCTSCGSSVENIPLQAERHSGSRQRLFGLPPESVFSFRPECCSASQRNGVQLQTGIAFTFDRIPQAWQFWLFLWLLWRSIAYGGAWTIRHVNCPNDGNNPLGAELLGLGSQ